MFSIASSDPSDLLWTFENNFFLFSLLILLLRTPPDYGTENKTQISAFKGVF